MRRHLRSLLRGATSLLLFGLFGLGALLITPAMLVLRRPERCQPLVRATWRLMTCLFVWTRLIRIERGNLGEVTGAVVVANHPSLIDVVLIVSLLPRTLYVAKRGLRANPVLAAIVRATSLPDDGTLPDRAAPYLAAGWNVLVFPEGTRSPAEGGLKSLRRGAAQVALRTGSPVVCVRLEVSRRILGKGQRPWDLGDRTVTYGFTLKALEPDRSEVSAFHTAAIRLTERIRAALQ